MRKKIAIIGDPSVGFLIAQSLQHTHDLVVIDSEKLEPEKKTIQEIIKEERAYKIERVHHEDLRDVTFYKETNHKFSPKKNWKQKRKRK